MVGRTQRSVQSCKTPTYQRKRSKPVKYTPELLKKYSKKTKGKNSRDKNNSIPEFTTKVKGRKIRDKKKQDDFTTESSAEDECSTPTKINEKAVTDGSDDEVIEKKQRSQRYSMETSEPTDTKRVSTQKENIFQVSTDGSDGEISPLLTREKNPGRIIENIDKKQRSQRYSIDTIEPTVTKRVFLQEENISQEIDFKKKYILT